MISSKVKESTQAYKVNWYNSSDTAWRTTKLTEDSGQLIDVKKINATFIGN